MTTFPAGPVLQQLDDGTRWQLVEAYRYAWTEGGTNYRLTIRAGMVTDKASVPELAWSVIGNHELTEAAALAHDAGYGRAGRWGDLLEFQLGDEWVVGGPNWTRERVDRLFLRIMKESRIARWKSALAYRAVRWFGADTWRRYAKIGAS